MIKYRIDSLRIVAIPTLSVVITVILLMVMTAVSLSESAFAQLVKDPGASFFEQRGETHTKTLNPIVAWNNLTINFGLKEKIIPEDLKHTLAIMHMSMYDSLLASNLTTQTADFVQSSTVVSEAASTVLSHYFPQYERDINLLRDMYSIAIESSAANVSNGKNIVELIDIGKKAGEQALLFSNSTSEPELGLEEHLTTAQGPCVWNGSDPILPTAGHWKTYILESGTEFQPPAPYLCGSEEDIKELLRVQEARANITPGQISVVHYWGDFPAYVIWNGNLNERIIKNNLSVFEAARASAYLNVGMYDGFVSNWYTKYDHWTARPFQRLVNFTTVIRTPNFPGYTSAHAVISAVASKVLGEVFPEEKSHFEDLANEAASSRLWGGIHFEQDNVMGLDQGAKIGDKIVNDMHKTIHPFLYDR